jgi:hypothetical protein
MRKRATLAEAAAFERGRFIPYRGVPPLAVFEPLPPPPPMDTERDMALQLAARLDRDYRGFCDFWPLLGMWLELDQANRRFHELFAQAQQPRWLVRAPAELQAAAAARGGRL